MSRTEKRALQIAVAIGSLVPIGAGTTGMLLGLRMLESNSVESGDLDSHFRYLSGLLLAIGIGYATTVPRIETQGCRFRLLTVAVVLGGVGRFFSLLSIGPPSSTMAAALIMELLVAPGLALWQHRVAFQTRGSWRHRAFRSDVMDIAALPATDMRATALLLNIVVAGLAVLALCATSRAPGPRGTSLDHPDVVIRVRRCS